MAAERELNENQIRHISTLLNMAITNKDHPNIRDLRRVAVLFNSINNLGFLFVDGNVYDIIDRFFPTSFSDEVKEDLGNIANVCNYLVEGLHGRQYDEFDLKTEEQLNNIESSF